MTKLPSNNTKISLLGLAVLGISAIMGTLYHIDKWFANGMTIKRVAETCNGLKTGCSDSFMPILYIMGDPQQLLLSLAIVGFLVALVKAVMVIISARRVASRYVLPGSMFPGLSKVLSELKAEDITVRVSDEDNVTAFTYGVLNPTICLSKGLIDSLGDGEFTALIAHEIGHVRRRDNLAIFVALFVRDFLWLLPISHHLFAIFVREKEYAADDFAVSLTKNPLDLAGAIVSVAKAVRGRNTLSPAYAAFLPGKATAKTRINRLLGSDDKVKPSLFGLLISLMLSALMMLTIVGFTYAQPFNKGMLPDKCCVGETCSEQVHKCCKVE